MSGDDTQKYIEQIKEGWNQLSGGVAEQVKKYTGMGGDEGPSFLPTNMMGGSEPSAAEKSKGAEKSKVEKVDEVQKTATGGGNASADDPLGLGK